MRKCRRFIRAEPMRLSFDLSRSRRSQAGAGRLNGSSRHLGTLASRCRYAANGRRSLFLQHVGVRVVGNVGEASRSPIFARTPDCVLRLFEQLGVVDKEIAAVLLDSQLQVVCPSGRLEDASTFEAHAVIS